MNAGVMAALLVFASVCGAERAWRAARGARARTRLGPRAVTRPVAARHPRVHAPPAVQRRVEAAGAAIDVDAVWLLWLGASVLAVAAVLTVVGAGAAALAAGALTAAPATALTVMARGRRRRVGATLPAALDELARSLRAGASLFQAIDDAGHATPGVIGDDLMGVAAAHRSGVTLADALARWRLSRPIPGVRLTASALELGLAAGGTHARAVDGVAATLRDNLSISAEVRAQAAQAQASALVIGLAPLGFTALACLADPRTAAFLFQTPAGLMCLTLGVVLDAAGALWMARITRTPE